LYIINCTVAFPHVPFKLLSFQVSVLADDILKNVEFDALRIVFNKFHSVVQFLPTTATILSPEVMGCF
jgi:F0F1-type ATP synthase gamma subunit